jgi:uncharacterized damage-inducible protein DinB
MIYGSKELAESFRTVRKNTIEIAKDIPEDQYGFTPAPGVRSVGETLVHIALSTSWQSRVHRDRVDDLSKVDFQSAMATLNAEMAKPRSKREIIALLESEGVSFATFLEGLSDDFLAERVAMRPGQQPASRTRFEMLLGPKEHEMHHRGQLMLVERMLGIVPHLTRQFQEQMARNQVAQAQR